MKNHKNPNKSLNFINLILGLFVFVSILKWRYL
nr:MAG TPA: hypothetical protein [Caudoviricetes sp.]